MASSLLALLDDIATVLDDISILTKVAAKKTAGVLGDDLAVNAEQVSGVRAARELPVVWAVFKGSLRNKLILVPAALAISAVLPWAIIPLLMLGGAFLCFEGFEKVAHRFLHADAGESAHEAELARAVSDPQVDLVALERDKIRGAIRTDFILSAEIIAITLGTVAEAGFATRLGVLSSIAVVMTIGVYGLVAGIVKLDDAGLYLSRRQGDGALLPLQRRLGRGLIAAAPHLMRFLTVAGTLAMFLVGGGILTHGIPVAAEAIHHLAEIAAGLAGIGGVLGVLTPLLLNLLVGLITGGVLLALVTLVQRLRRPAG